MLIVTVVVCPSTECRVGSAAAGISQERSGRSAGQLAANMLMLATANTSAVWLFHFVVTLEFNDKV